MSESLESRLRHLAHDLHVEVPANLEGAVLARVVREPAVSRPRRAGRWIAGLILALLGVGAAATPVGASLLDWFGFHGVTVVEDRVPATDDPVVPGEREGRRLDRMDRMAELVGFTPVVPAELGDPDGAAMSADRRVVSLSWGRGADTVRLDQFRGTIDPVFSKTATDASFVAIDAGEALWLPTPHHLSVVAEDGWRQRLAPRTAAPTLVWVQDGVTLRLEGDHSLERAVAIADSAG